MRVVIINKSDSTGGAAVVSRRLMEALRQQGVDAGMLVVEKLTESPFVECIGGNSWCNFHERAGFIYERLKIFVANGFNRSTLFKIDTGEEGLPLWRHPLVRQADAILINWVNQGILSLKGFRKILKLGKPVIWTMHDMWEMTGICHHSENCRHFTEECGNCFLLGKKAFDEDLSHKVWKRKMNIYSDKSLMSKSAFVAVSTWLKNKALESSLLKAQCLEIIPNAFDLKNVNTFKRHGKIKETVRILFGAARLDDPIKGLETLKITAGILKERNPEKASRLEIAMFGNIKNPEILEGFKLPVAMLGIIKGEENIRETYEQADILVSASSYETLPGTLVEAQAFGCIPVSFNRGGQSDIVTDGTTGILTDYSENILSRASNLADGILKAMAIIEDETRYEEILTKMRENVEMKFSYKEVAKKYLCLMEKLRQ